MLASALAFWSFDLSPEGETALYSRAIIMAGHSWTGTLTPSKPGVCNLSKHIIIVRAQLINLVFISIS